MLTLARQWLRRDRFADLAQPVLDRIAREFGVTMLGVQIVGLDHIIVVAPSQVGGSFQLSAQVGSRFPALISATGRCIAAFGGYREADLAARFATLRWDDPPSFAEWQAQVAETRDEGVCSRRGQLHRRGHRAGRAGVDRARGGRATRWSPSGSMER